MRGLPTENRNNKTKLNTLETDTKSMCSTLKNHTRKKRWAATQRPHYLLPTPEKKTPKKLPERVPAPSPTTVIFLTALPKTEKLLQPKETHRQQAAGMPTEPTQAPENLQNHSSSHPKDLTKVI